MQSGAGAQLLGQLKDTGLTEQQATGAMSATAEGVAQQMQGGAGGGDLLGGLGGALGGLMGGGGAPAGGGLVGMLSAPVAQFVAQKTGLAPAMAQQVVAVVLPKLVELVSGGGGGAAPAGGAGGGLGGMLGGLLK